MKRYQTIVVATALDERDATTLKFAARFAQAAESKAMYVTHVTPSFDLPVEAMQGQAELLVPVDEEVEQRLRNTVAAFPGLFPAATQIHYVARQGSLVPELVRLAAQKSADLICVGRRPRDEHDPLSDAAVKILRKSPCSVFVVPAGAELECRRILVPLDFSDHAREALDVAAAVATCMPDATITVEHVYNVLSGYHKLGQTYEQAAGAMKKLAEWQWDKFAPRVNLRGVPCQIRYDLGDKVPKTILAVSDELDVQLIVLASHGRTRPAGVLLGHVAESVCAKTTGPVLCVKKKGEVVNLLHGVLQLFELESKD